MGLQNWTTTLRRRMRRRMRRETNKKTNQAGMRWGFLLEIKNTAVDDIFETRALEHSRQLQVAQHANSSATVTNWVSLINANSSTQFHFT